MLVLASSVDAAPRPVTVFLERNGSVVDHEGEEVAIPKFGGGDPVWTEIVGCVKTQFAPFQIDVVDTQPRGGDFITAVIGGRASQLGLSDRSTNGVGPYIPGRVQPNATVHIFSKVSGERDAKNLCAVTVHEVSHALGLDHTYKCGDFMSYFLDRCGPRKFLDVDAPCGEFSVRVCGDGKKTQNSYRMMAALVGLRETSPQPQPEPRPELEPEPDPDTDTEPQTDDTEIEGGDSIPDDRDDATDDATEDATDDATDEPAQEYPRWRGRYGRYSVERYRDGQGRTWVIVRRYR